MATLTPDLTLAMVRQLATQWRLPWRLNYASDEVKAAEATQGLEALKLCTRLVQEADFSAWSATQKQTLSEVLHKELLGHQAPKEKDGGTVLKDTLRQLLMGSALIDLDDVHTWRTQFSDALSHSPQAIEALLKRPPRKIAHKAERWTVPALLHDPHWRSPMGGAGMNWNQEWPTMAAYLVHRASFWAPQPDGKSLLEKLCQYGFDLSAVLSYDRPLLAMVESSDLLDQALAQGVRPWQVGEAQRAAVLQQGLWHWTDGGTHTLSAPLMKALAEDLSGWSPHDREAALGGLLHLALRRRDEPQEEGADSKSLARQLTTLVGGARQIPLERHDGTLWSIDGRKAYEWLLRVPHRLDWDPSHAERAGLIKERPRHLAAPHQLNHMSLEGVPDAVWILLAQSKDTTADQLCAHPIYTWMSKHKNSAALDQAIIHAWHVLRQASPPERAKHGPSLALFPQQQAVTLWHTWQQLAQELPQDTVGQRLGRLAEYLTPVVMTMLMADHQLWRNLDHEVRQTLNRAIDADPAQTTEWALMGWLWAFEGKSVKGPERAAYHQQRNAWRQRWDDAVAQGVRWDDAGQPHIVDLWRRLAPQHRLTYEATVLADAIHASVEAEASETTGAPTASLAKPRRPRL